jgi:hypothetical protein
MIEIIAREDIRCGDLIFRVYKRYARRARAKDCADYSKLAVCYRDTKKGEVISSAWGIIDTNYGPKRKTITGDVIG